MAESNPTVEYREIPGHPAYRVGSDGSVWSTKIRGRWNIRAEWRRLKPVKTAAGYLQVRLDGRPLVVHRLVLQAFVGPCPDGQQARHVNSNDRTNNGLSNLCWGTPAENFADTKRHGTHASRLQKHRILTDEQARGIVSALLSGENPLVIAERMGITRRLVTGIRCGAYYSHLLTDELIHRLSQVPQWCRWGKRKSP